MASSFYNNSVLLTKFVGWLVLELLFYILVQTWLFNLPTIPLDFWSIKTGENTFIFDSDRCITWLFLPQSEELAESWFDWTDADIDDDYQLVPTNKGGYVLVIR